MISVFNFKALRVFDSHTPAKWAVFKYSCFWPTADCCLKCSLRMSALMEEFIPSPFFHTEQGFNHFKQEVSAWLHQIPSTSPACHSTCSPSPPFTIPSPGPLYPPSSFLLPQPAHSSTLGFGTMWNLPGPEPSWATVAEAAAQEYIVEVFVSHRKMCPYNPAYAFLFRKSFQTLFSYSRDFHLQSVKGYTILKNSKVWSS